jgi:protein kinase A
LEFLHTKNIVYRDLHPENLLFDHKGYFRLIDFGFAKVCEGKTYTLCGTPEYMAPEIFLNKGHGKPVDWWAFGCILYEMLVGITPFFDNDPILIFKKVLRGDIKFPTNFPPAAKSLILHCLEKDENKRYGCLTRGIKDIKEHRFFNGLDMASLSKQKMRVVYLPPIDNADDMKLLKIITDEEEEAEEIDPAKDPFDDWIRKNK